MKMQQTTLLCNTKKLQGIEPMGLFIPWGDCGNKQFFKKMEIKQTTLRCETKHLQVNKPMGIGAPLDNTYLHK